MQLVQAFFREAPNRTTLFDYDARTDGQPIYIGHAQKDTSQNAADWTIFKFTYNGSNFVTNIDSVSEAVWSLRSEYFS
jgi:hypothetical protein